MLCLQIKLEDQILADDSHLPLFEVRLLAILACLVASLSLCARAELPKFHLQPHMMVSGPGLQDFSSGLRT